MARVRRVVPQRSQAHVALGEAVRQLREKKGLSQEDFAHLSGVHRTYMSDIERGTRNPGYANIRKIADALHISASELLMRAEELEKTAQIRHKIDTPRRPRA